MLNLETLQCLSGGQVSDFLRRKWPQETVHVTTWKDGKRWGGMPHRKWHLTTHFPSCFQAQQAEVPLGIWSTLHQLMQGMSLHTGWWAQRVNQGPFLSLITNPVRVENDCSALWFSISHSWLVIRKLLMSDTCLEVVATFNILKCRTQRESPPYRMTMHIEKRK